MWALQSTQPHSSGEIPWVRGEAPEIFFQHKELQKPAESIVFRKKNNPLEKKERERFFPEK